ncbi:MAG: ATP-binding protein [Pseudomonadales bacterium]|jgi:predicted AAA+ superfamily ATPase|nr:ATP-binding protein [Pseudomonadales bacterium]
MADDDALARAARDFVDLAARLRGEGGRSGDGVDFAAVRAASWREGPLGGHLAARGHLDAMALDDLIGIDRQKARVAANTRQFVAGLPANNVLLWGARGTGKSSLVHALLNEHADAGLRLVEVERTALQGLPDVVDRLAGEPFRFIVFCDDLSFEADDPSYKVLKSVLDGSVFETAANVLIYATSNRRHLMPEFQHENLEARHTADGEVHPGETTEEKVSLSDRFGLWVSFQPFPQARYLDVAAHWVATLAATAGVAVPFDDEARAEALRWALGRGSRSGRTANHFARHWVGQQALALQDRR